MPFKNTRAYLGEISVGVLIIANLANFYDGVKTE
jgi:hypothetical protein